MDKPLHSPTLESIAMVEEAIKKYSTKLGKYQLWKKLPRKMMYQTFVFILNYLEKSEKINIDKKISWIAKESEKIFKTLEINQKMKKESQPISPEFEKIVESLNTDERAVLPFLHEKDFKKIIEKTGLDETRVLRALQFLGNKSILKTETKEKNIADLDENGTIYLKNGLPERRLLNVLAEHKTLELSKAKELSKLSENEFKAAIGALKSGAMIELKEGKIILNARKEETIKKSFEEHLIESLPLNLDELKPEQRLALDNLKKRKQIVKIYKERAIEIELTELGKKIASINLKDVQLIESLTSEIIKNDSWRGKKFRRYDITSKVPEIEGGKRHFVEQARDYARKIWSELGFKEMSSTLTQTGFWNFDALFTAQDHPVREIQDTFYIKDIKGKLPDKKIVEAVKKSHEQGVSGSKGWRYSWNEDEAKKVVLRTHTTCLSAKTLAGLRDLKDKRGKFFSIGKCFRNETIDWSHGFEFNQTEGIVIDKDANFRHLLGYLQEFYKKMGFEKVKFVPSFFPYTEPSVEIYAFNKERKIWIEVGGAGIFRPEVVVPLLGEYIPILAWGQGFDRIITEYYGIKDLREMYKNDIKQLRKMRFWIK